jgi:hypothetical protein
MPNNNFSKDELLNLMQFFFGKLFGIMCIKTFFSESCDMCDVVDNFFFGVEPLIIENFIFGIHNEYLAKLHTICCLHHLAIKRDKLGLASNDLAWLVNLRISQSMFLLCVSDVTSYACLLQIPQ